MMGGACGCSCLGNAFVLDVDVVTISDVSSSSLRSL